MNKEQTANNKMTADHPLLFAICSLLSAAGDLPFAVCRLLSAEGDITRSDP
jgi:hypothetical protein